MSEPIYWVSVSLGEPPTEKQVEEISKAIGENLDHDAIVTTDEIKPMSESERKEIIRELLGELDE